MLIWIGDLDHIFVSYYSTPSVMRPTILFCITCTILHIIYARQYAVILLAWVTHGIAFLYRCREDMLSLTSLALADMYHMSLREGAFLVAKPWERKERRCIP